MKSEFGRKIEKLQAIQGMSTGELAKKIGLSITNVSQMKRSKRPRPVTIHRIAKAFDVDVDLFLSE